jgi:hypothetical protein
MAMVVYVDPSVLARLIVIAAASLLSSPVFAVQTFNVNDKSDQIDDDLSDGVCHTAVGTCTLRAAVMQANVSTGAGATIVLPADVYYLTRPAMGAEGVDGGLSLAAPGNGDPVVSIVGAGAASTIIDANQIDRALTVHSHRTVVITGVTIRNGFVATGEGGAILNFGTLTLDHVVVTANTAQLGGGISNSIGKGLPTAAKLTLQYSTIFSNTSTNSGGGIFNDRTLTINASTIASNAATYGGGVYNSGTMTMINATVANNTANENGGGLLNNFGSPDTTNVYNSTIVGNDADHDRDGSGAGGGIFGYTTYSGVANIYNTLIAGNYDANSPVLPDDCGGPIATHATNLFGTTDGCSITQISGSNGFLNSLSFLGPLENNGGPTATIALIFGSHAIDGAPLGCFDPNSQPITMDQRGYPRLGICDIGAYEFEDLIFHDGFDFLPIH